MSNTSDDRIRSNAVLCRLRSYIAMMAPYRENHRSGRLLMEAAAEIERLLTIQPDAEPVDWPTEPGWWWMESDWSMGSFTTVATVLVRYNEHCEMRWRDGRLLFREFAIRNNARFLRAPVPTFTPREE